MEPAPCECHKLFENHPPLRSGLDHVLFRHPSQWRAVFSEEVAVLMGGKARGRLWHSDGAKEEAIEKMTEELGSLCLPTPDFDDGQHDCIPFFDPPTIELMRHVVCEDVEHHEFKPTGATNLEEEVVDKARGELRRLNLVGGMGQGTH